MKQTARRRSLVIGNYPVIWSSIVRSGIVDSVEFRWSVNVRSGPPFTVNTYLFDCWDGMPEGHEQDGVRRNSSCVHNVNKPYYLVV